MWPFPLLLPFLLLLAWAPIGVQAQSPVDPTGPGSDGLTTATAYRITELGNLVWMQQQAAANQSAGKYYALMNDIDASVTATWNDAATTTDTLEGFLPIGTSGSPFLGLFEGNSQKIAGLIVNRPGSDGAGLFGCIGLNGVVRDLVLDGGAVTGRDFVGGPVGYSDRGMISNVFATGAVAGRSYVGGLLGGAHFGTVLGCYATGKVTGSSSNVGGLLGYNYCATITSCYATGAVTGLWTTVGGLIGDSVSGTVATCFATGAATGSSNVGGLIAVNEQTAVSTCYAAGAVTGSGSGVGGLIASNVFGTVAACYWDTQRSGQAGSGGGTGETTAQMQQQGTFLPAGTLPGRWDFAAVWGIQGAYPYLRSFPTHTLTYTAGANGSIDSATSRSQTVNQGAQGATVTAVPVGLCHFVRWSDGSADNPRTDTNVVSNISVMAIFSNQRTLTYLAGPGGSVAGATSQTVTQGTDGTQVTAVAATGYHFLKWSDGVLTAARTDLGVTGDITVTASFAINRYHLSYTAGPHGSVSGATSQTLNYGGNGTQVTAVPATGYHFVQWSDGALTAARRDMNVSGNITVTASFSINLFSLTYAAGPNGFLDGVTSQTVGYGQIGSPVLAVADAGWYFAIWSDGSAANPRTDTNVKCNVDVTALFLPPIPIHTLAELQAVATGNLGAIYTLMNDIDASPTATWPGGFQPIGTSSAGFRGVFDGNGHKIVGLTVNRPTTNYIGLFGYVGAGGVVRNLTLEGGSVTGSSYTGGLVGCNSGGTLTSCTVTDAVTGLGTSELDYIGGLVGYNSGSTVESCHAISTVTAMTTATATGTAETAYTNYVGGLVGSNVQGGTITGSSATGAVTVASAVKSNLRFSGSARNQYVGGLAGYNMGCTITDCFTSCAVRAANTAYNCENEGVGGLIGFDEAGALTNCYAVGRVTATNTPGTPSGDEGPCTNELVGGLVGEDRECAIASCHADGAVTAENICTVYGSLEQVENLLVGGLIGNVSQSTVTNCYAVGPVTCTGVGCEYFDTIAVGGLIGDNSQSTVTNCYAVGSVISTGRGEGNWSASGVGGLIGFNERSGITDCFATGDTTVEANNWAGSLSGGAVGGLVGGNYGGSAITGCYASGAVTSVVTYAYHINDVGGLVGSNHTTCTLARCYATGAVTGYRDVGGLVGSNGDASTITICYAAGPVSGSSNAGGLVGSHFGKSTVTDSYWDVETTGLATSDGGTSESTTLMTQQSTFAGWDFTTVWNIVGGINYGYPYLRTLGAGAYAPNEANTPSPIDGASAVPVDAALSWHNGGWTSSYDVYLDTANPPVTRVATSLTETIYNPSAPLAHGTTYFWRIGAKNSAGTTTGQVWTFTTVATPEKATTPSPVNGATGLPVDLTLGWQNGGGATSYNIFLGTSNPPSQCVATRVATAYVPASPLAYGTTYFWRVDAKNSAGLTMGDVWSFTTAPAPAAPGKASTPSPADGATSQSVDVALGWQNGGGAASYDVYFGTANPPVTCVSTSQTATGYAPDSSLAYATTYFWRVDSKNAVGTTSGDIWSFTTAPAPPAPALAVTPAHRNVPAAAVGTSFAVANLGTGTMGWTAQVTSGSAWLAISSGANGTDAGTIHVSVAANSGGARTGTITVTATNASDGGAQVADSPQTVTVTQAAVAPPVIGNFLSQRAKSSHAERWDAAGVQIDVKDAYSFSAKMQIPAASLASISNATTLTLVLGDDATSGATHVLLECALAAATKSTLAGHLTAKTPKDPARGGAVMFVAMQAGSPKKARVVSLKWTKTGLLTVTVLGTPAPASWAPTSPAARRVRENVADLCGTQWSAGAAAGVAVPAFVQLHGVFADGDTLTCAGKKKVTSSDGGDLIGWSVSGK